MAQQVQHLHAEEGELAVLNELAQVRQPSLARIRNLLQSVNKNTQGNEAPLQMRCELYIKLQSSIHLQKCASPASRAARNLL
jgi:hypothetical protein